ncbi:MAG: hypothetical protein N2V78_09420 [Methanophagales archaeon]|nr:hypothetical protein [Methanophagales archaeon]
MSRSIVELLSIARKVDDRLSEFELKPYEHLIVCYMLHSAAQYAYNETLRKAVKNDE